VIRLAFVLLLAFALFGCSNLAPGYRAVTATIQTGNQTGKLLAAGCRYRKEQCVNKHKDDRGKLKECLDPCLRALEIWTKYTRPAVNSAAAVTFAALETARLKKESVDWIHLIKPGACALIRSFNQFSPLIGASEAAELKKGLKFIEAALCPN
jgi:hypothetical protein